MEIEKRMPLLPMSTMAWRCSGEGAVVWVAIVIVVAGQSSWCCLSFAVDNWTRIVVVPFGLLD